MSGIATILVLLAASISKKHTCHGPIGCLMLFDPGLRLSVAHPQGCHFFLRWLLSAFGPWEYEEAMAQEKSGQI